MPDTYPRLIWSPDPDAEYNAPQLATDWHGGQASMLYAVSSTGSLARGTTRPYGVVSDADWNRHLAWLLWREIRECVTAAMREDTEDAEHLEMWAADVETVFDHWAAIADAEDAEA